MTEFRHRADLRLRGFTGRSLTAAVRSGALIRARRDHYLAPDTPDEMVRAVRVGGRLTCLSLLALLGAFVWRVEQLHVHVPPHATRLRSPHDRRRRLEPRDARGAMVHWTFLHRHPGRAAFVDIFDALVHAVRCQSPRAMVATLDSALRLGLIVEAELAELFSVLPARYGILAALVDPRSESGPETFVRLMLRALGCDARPQVQIDGVGRVDFLVEGWLVIECDSERHHGTWAERERDLLRDVRLAALGYQTLRLSARVVLYQPDVALAAIRGLLAARG